MCSTGIKEWMKGFFISSFLMLFATNLLAQGFGRNKVQYEQKNFRIKETPHFDIYHYFNDDSVINYWALTAEKWYQKHQEVFHDTFKIRNPIILYANHADFAQTNTVSGLIGVGTGGVTEGLKNRVILPVNEVNAQTNHVLGHELVHAFQYHILLKNNTRGLNNIRNIPLWMIEGMAEYMSLGSKDANTAMWMRDAVQQDDVPTLKDLTKGFEYFPYRYGQAFWAFVGGVWGDSVIAPLLVETARRGYNQALKKVLNVDEKSFSGMWKSALKTYYSDLMHDSSAAPAGKLIFNDKNAGRMNVTPSLSPDGRLIAFVSDKDIFTNDVYLADVANGKIEKRLYSTEFSGHTDAIGFIESGLTWSPHSDHLAIVITSEGRNKLAIIDAANRNRVDEYGIPGVPAFSYPAWSPDGKMIAVSGLVEGHSDLYLYHISNHSVLRLTKDGYSDIQPSWSPDGKYIAFATDRTTDGKSISDGLNLAYINLENGQLKVLDVFPGADNLNPVFSKDGKSLYFLSDRDGFRDLYRYDLESHEVYQLSHYFTGISGITPYSPAISISPGKNQVAYSYYSKKEYRLYIASLSDFNENKVDKYAVDQKAAILPVYPKDSMNIVNASLTMDSSLVKVSVDSLKEKPYEPKFKLDYVGNTGGIGIGVGAGGYGSQSALYGGANLLFSDMLGNNFLYTGVALNGEIYDFAGAVSYLNRSHRIGWGVTGSHIPYRYSTIGYGYELRPEGQDTLLLDEARVNTYRTFEENINLFAFYPFSQTTRVELGGGYMHYSYRLDQERYYYLQGLFYDYQKEKLDAPSGYSLQTVNAAFVKDNSFFGMASPSMGFRYRIGVEKYFDKLDFYTFLADFRKYYFFKPFTAAFRLIHYARLGSDAESGLLYPLSFAYPSLTRGNQFSTNSPDSTSRFNISQIYGSRILVGNVELRIPLTGPEQLALIKSGFLFSELAVFLDAGLAWDREHSPSLEYIPDSTSKRVPYYTAGLSYRINLFGAMVIEPYLAFPLQKSSSRKPTFGVNFLPGW